MPLLRGDMNSTCSKCKLKYEAALGQLWGFHKMCSMFRLGALYKVEWDSRSHLRYPQREMTSVNAQII